MYKKLIFLLLAAVILLGLASCGKNKSTSPDPTVITGDCRGCHTDEVKLKALAIPDTSGDGDSGEG